MKKSFLILSLVIMVVGVSFAGITLSASEANSILFMVEEEKLARDVYLTLYDKWGLITFSNIARSEQRHVELSNTSSKSTVLKIQQLTK